MDTGRLFKKNYVLIDYENVQPKSLSALSDEHFHIYLFLGAKQSKIDVPFAKSMHAFGPLRSHYVSVAKTGNNALDFHITYYLGKLSQQNPAGYFHIISKDKGYDPLIEHLKSINIEACRRESIADIPILNIAKGANIDDKLKAVIANLKGRGNAKPRKEKTLKNLMKNVFGDKLTETEIIALYKNLLKSKFIKSDNGNISYSLPR